MNKFLYAIITEAGKFPKKYKVHKVRVVRENPEFITIEFCDSFLTLDKHRKTLFDTRSEANKYIKTILSE